MAETNNINGVGGNQQHVEVKHGLADQLFAKYVKNEGVTEALFAQLYQTASEKYAVVSINGKDYASEQKDDVIEQLQTAKQTYLNDPSSENQAAVTTLIQSVVDAANPEVCKAEGRKPKHTELTDAENKELNDYLSKLEAHAKEMDRIKKQTIKDEINTDIDTDLTSTIKDAVQLAEQVKGLMSKGLLDKRLVLENIRQASKAADSALHIAHLAENMSTPASARGPGFAKGLAEAQLAMATVSTITGIVSAIQSNKEMSKTEAAELGLSTAISAQNGTLAFLLLMTGKVSQADAVPMHDAIMVITIMNVAASIVRKGVGSDKDELMRNLGDEILKGLPHIAGRLTSTIGTLTGSTASVSASVPVMAALTLVTNEIMYQRDMYEKNAENEQSKEAYTSQLNELRSEAEEMKVFTDMVYDQFVNNPEVLSSNRELYDDYVERRREDKASMQLSTAKTSAGYQADVQKRAVARGIEIANVAITAAAVACPPAQLGLILTGSLSLSMAVFGNRIIETTANGNFNIPSLLKDAILITDLQSANKLVANRDIERFYQPNIVMMEEVITPGRTISNPVEAVNVLLDRAKDKVSFNLALPDDVDSKGEFVGDLQSFRDKMTFMQALQDKVGISATNMDMLTLYPNITNLEQILSKLQEEGRQLMEQYDTVVTKMLGDGHQELTENIHFLKNCFSENSRLKMADTFKQQSPEAFYENKQVIDQFNSDMVFGGAGVAARSASNAGKSKLVGDHQQEYGKFVMKMMLDLQEKIKAAVTIQANLNPDHNQMIKNHKLMIADFKEQQTRLNALVEKGQLTIDPDFQQQVTALQSDIGEQLEDLVDQVNVHNLALHEKKVKSFDADKNEEKAFEKQLKDNQQAVVIERGKYSVLGVIALKKNVSASLAKIIDNPGQPNVVLEGLLAVGKENINDVISAKGIHDRIVGLTRAVHFIVELDKQLQKHNAKHGTNFKIENINNIISDYSKQLKILSDKQVELLNTEKRELSLTEAGKLKDAGNQIKLFLTNVGVDLSKEVFGRTSTVAMRCLEKNMAKMASDETVNDKQFYTFYHESLHQAASKCVGDLKRIELEMEHPDIQRAVGARADAFVKELRDIIRMAEIERGRVKEAADIRQIHDRLVVVAEKLTNLSTQYPDLVSRRVAEISTVMSEKIKSITNEVQVASVLGGLNHQGLHEKASSSVENLMTKDKRKPAIRGTLRRGYDKFKSKFVNPKHKDAAVTTKREPVNDAEMVSDDKLEVKENKSFNPGRK